MKVYPKITGALCVNSHPGSYTGQDAYNDMLPVIENSSGGGLPLRLTPATTKEVVQEMEKNESSSSSERQYVVRRLTPKERCRLQGFPDWWDADVEGTDSNRYKMWGNGIALNCAFDILRRIAEEVKS